MDTNYTSIYKIAKELYKEDIENGEYVTDNFNDYYGRVLKKFKEILSGLGMDYEVLKNIDEDEYRIALSQKENVKEMIRSYKNKPMRLARNKKFDEVSTNDLKLIVDNLDNVLKESLDNNRYDKEISSIYLTTRIAYNEKVNNLKKDGIGEILSDIEYLKPLELDKTLSEMDKIALLNYYIKLIGETSFKFRSIVNKLSDIRESEVVDIGCDMAEKSVDENRIEEEFGSRIMESTIAIWEAEKLFEDELIEKYTKIKNKIPKHELDAIERLLKERGRIE